jgi:hypothetical protein
MKTFEVFREVTLKQVESISVVAETAQQANEIAKGLSEDWRVISSAQFDKAEIIQTEETR